MALMDIVYREHSERYTIDYLGITLEVRNRDDAAVDLTAQHPTREEWRSIMRLVVSVDFEKITRVQPVDAGIQTFTVVHCNANSDQRFSLKPGIDFSKWHLTRQGLVPIDKRGGLLMRHVVEFVCMSRPNQNFDYGDYNNLNWFEAGLSPSMMKIKAKSVDSHWLYEEVDNTTQTRDLKGVIDLHRNTISITRSKKYYNIIDITDLNSGLYLAKFMGGIFNGLEINDASVPIRPGANFANDFVLMRHDLRPIEEQGSGVMQYEQHVELRGDYAPFEWT